MDLSQKKLNKHEWEAIEVPLSSQEKKILNLVREGYTDVNIKCNDALSLMNFMKITKDFELYHSYFYELYSLLSRDMYFMVRVILFLEICEILGIKIMNCKYIL